MTIIQAPYRTFPHPQFIEVGDTSSLLTEKFNDEANVIIWPGGPDPFDGLDFGELTQIIFNANDRKEVRLDLFHGGHRKKLKQYADGAKNGHLRKAVECIFNDAEGFYEEMHGEHPHWYNPKFCLRVVENYCDPDDVLAYEADPVTRRLRSQGIVPSEFRDHAFHFDTADGDIFDEIILALGRFGILYEGFGFEILYNSEIKEVNGSSLMVPTWNGYLPLLEEDVHPVSLWVGDRWRQAVVGSCKRPLGHRAPVVSKPRMFGLGWLEYL